MSFNCKEWIAFFSCVSNYNYGSEDNLPRFEDTGQQNVSTMDRNPEVEEAEEVDESYVFLSEYPSKGQIVNPRLPYVGALPKPLQTGHTIVIDGTVLPEAVRFSVNLVCGIHTEGDYAFHFNPRFERNFVIRNSKTDGRWGKEERSAPQRNPFKRGMPFHLYIFVAKDSFLVAVNGRHFCGFPIRVPISRVHSVHIHGDINLFGIEHRHTDVYPVPGTGEESITIPVPTESCPCTTTDEEKVFGSQHIIMPEVPFYGHLPNGLALGRQIEIIGRVKTLPHSFFINLQQGRQTYPSPEVALHINPRFETDEYIVLNSWLKKSGWGQEVRTGKKSLIFRPGGTFTLIISVQSDGYIILVNGQTLVTYKHYANPLHVDTVYIQGDVVLQHVYAR